MGRTTEDTYIANRNYPSQRLFGMHLLPVRLDAQIAIGSSGAPTISNGIGIKSITRLAAGTYQLQLDDNYAQFLSMSASMRPPVTGSAVAGGSFVATTVYQIVTLGTTTQAQWVTAGLPSGITAAVGQIFLAAGIGAGTGTVKAVGVSGISCVEVIGNPAQMLNNQPFQQGNGGAYINIQTLGATSSSVTTLIPTDATSGSVLNLQIMLNNSAVQ